MLVAAPYFPAVVLLFWLGSQRELVEACNTTIPHLWFLLLWSNCCYFPFPSCIPHNTCRWRFVTDYTIIFNMGWIDYLGSALGRSEMFYFKLFSSLGTTEAHCPEPLGKLLLIQRCTEPQPMSSGMWVTMPHSHSFLGKPPWLLDTLCLDVGPYVIMVNWG